MGGEVTKTFPVLLSYQERKQHPNWPREVPWDFIEPGRAQAMCNHDQTLETLSSRGGLCPGEMRCALEGKKLWPHFTEVTAAERDKRNDDDAAWLISALASHKEKP